MKLNEDEEKIKEAVRASWDNRGKRLSIINRINYFKEKFFRFERITFQNHLKRTILEFQFELFSLSFNIIKSVQYYI
jgi:hypothetical protein